MKSDCIKWRDELLEAALSVKTSPALERHLSSCAGCAEEMTRLKAIAVRSEVIETAVRVATSSGVMKNTAQTSSVMNSSGRKTFHT